MKDEILEEIREQKSIIQKLNGLRSKLRNICYKYNFTQSNWLEGGGMRVAAAYLGEEDNTFNIVLEGEYSKLHNIYFTLKTKKSIEFTLKETIINKLENHLENKRYEIDKLIQEALAAQKDLEELKKE